MISKKHRLLAGAALAACAVAASVVAAEDIWVKSDTVDIREGKGAVYPVLVTVPKGTKLSVLAHEGKWMQVQAGDQQGYVFEGAVSTTEVGSGGNLLSNLGAGPQASDLQTGAAAKGLEPATEGYAKSKNLDPAPLQKLVDFRKKIDPKAWEKFTADGKVGPNMP